MRVNGRMDTTCETENLSQPTFNETVDRGTVCRKAARMGLWGSGEATKRSTRNQLLESLVDLQQNKHLKSIHTKQK